MHMQKKCDFKIAIGSIILKNFPAPTVFKYFSYCLKRRPKQTRFFTSEQSALGDLLAINTSRIFLARCQLSYLESPQSKMSEAKILLITDRRKYENFIESHYFQNGPCKLISTTHSLRPQPKGPVLFHFRLFLGQSGYEPGVLIQRESYQHSSSYTSSRPRPRLDNCILGYI